MMPQMHRQAAFTHRAAIQYTAGWGKADQCCYKYAKTTESKWYCLCRLPLLLSPGKYRACTSNLHRRIP